MSDFNKKLDEALDEQQELYAIPHDGTLSGDSPFYPPEHSMSYFPGMTVDDIKKNPSLGEDSDDRDMVKGAWIVDQKTMRWLKRPLSTAVHSDQDYYKENNRKKIRLNDVAVGFIGPKPA